MSKTQRFLTLPKGMFDRQHDWVVRKRYLLDLHTKEGERIGSSLIEASPLGFFETYQRGSHNSGDKVYEFRDKAGRELCLACDSTPGVLRSFYNNEYSRGVTARLSFVAPLFRYRDGPTRHFTQIGYATVNEAASVGPIDFSLVQIAGALVSFFETSGLSIVIHLNDLRLLREVLQTCNIGEENVSSLLYRLQFSSFLERQRLLEEIPEPPCGRAALIAMFTEPVYQASVDAEGLHGMAQMLRDYTGADVLIDTTNLHSAETICGYSLQFYTKEGTRLGDGGVYNAFASRFHTDIKTLRSVATGIEAVIRQTSGLPLSTQPNDRTRALIVFDLGASPPFIARSLKKLQEQGYSVSYGGTPQNLGRAIIKAASTYDYVSVIGDSEEKSQRLSLKHLASRQVTYLV